MKRTHVRTSEFIVVRPKEAAKKEAENDRDEEAITVASASACGREAE